MVSHEGARGSSSGNKLQNGSFDFEKAFAIQESSHCGYDFATFGQDFASVRVHEQIEVTMPVSLLFVRQRSVDIALLVLLAEWNRADRLCEQHDLFDMYGAFAGARDERVALHPHEIAKIEQFESCENLFPDLVAFDVELNSARFVSNVRKADFSA